MTKARTRYEARHFLNRTLRNPNAHIHYFGLGFGVWGYFLCVVGEGLELIIFNPFFSLLQSLK